VRLINPFRMATLRTATFRTATLASAAFGCITLLLFAFIYWQTAGLETQRIDRFVEHESLAIAREAPGQIVADVETRYALDLHRESFAAVFTAAGGKVAGDLMAYPANLPRDSQPHRVLAARAGSQGDAVETVRALARPLPDGRVLVVGHTERDVAELHALLLRALAIGLVPALAAALCIGIFASRRTVQRLRAINQTIGRIMQGQLQERLPVAASGDDALRQLAMSVNRMLDDIERLMEEMRGVGDDIAHDLRTPLARVRARLEGGLARAESQAALATIVQNALGDLDQSFALITALLRIGQIEGSARRAGFGAVDLGAIARGVGELYQPVAELREVTLSVVAGDGMIVHGDRDLLFEAAANLVDNAVKFTPADGAVTVRVYAGELGAVVAVSDTGPGIPVAEREAALKRFHRGDRTRHVPGHGLGLSLVTAIVRLHMFHLYMAETGPGLLVEIRTWQEPERF
jgi:signal transduction histidine kinase